MSTTTPNNENERPWAVKTLTWLLLLEAFLFFGIGIFNAGTLQLWTQLSFDNLLSAFVLTLTNLTLYGALALLTIIAAIGFLNLTSRSWTYAVLVQGLALLTGIVLYRQSFPFYVVVVMTYGIFMTLYLHHPDVQTAFKVRQLTQIDGDEAI